MVRLVRGVLMSILQSQPQREMMGGMETLSAAHSRNQTEGERRAICAGQRLPPCISITLKALIAAKLMRSHVSCSHP